MRLQEMDLKQAPVGLVHERVFLRQTIEKLLLNLLCRSVWVHSNIHPERKYVLLYCPIYETTCHICVRLLVSTTTPEFLSS